MYLQQNLSKMKIKTLKQIEEAVRKGDVRRIIENTKTLETVERKNRVLRNYTEPKSESVIVI